MNLYHGGLNVVEIPVIKDSQRLLDFGKGFYTTSNREQAEKWAKIKQNRDVKRQKSIVTIYEIDENIFKNESFNVMLFSKADEQWLDFIFSNRMGLNVHHYDIVIGAVANDTLYSTLLLYETGVLSKIETIRRLKTHKLFDQISFHNQLVLKELQYSENYVVK
jgi:hypothetical protein